MKNYIKADEWSIIEEGFDPHLNKISESIFSLGNGRMGQRANFEETYTGETLPGTMLQAFIIRIKLVWAGGKMAIRNILPKF